METFPARHPKILLTCGRGRFYNPHDWHP